MPRRRVRPPLIRSDRPRNPAPFGRSRVVPRTSPLLPRPRVRRPRSVWTIQLKLRMALSLSTLALLLVARLYPAELRAFLNQSGPLGFLAIFALLLTPTAGMFLWHKRKLLK